MTVLITPTMLAAAKAGNPDINAAILAAAAAKWGIDTPSRVECWLANILNESGGLTVVSEDLTYTSAEWISEVFRSSIPNATAAAPYVRNPVALGNKVYAHLGPIAGGYAARGLGWGQLTGDAIHSLYATQGGMTLAEARAHMLTSEGAADSAGWYFAHMSCAAPADRGDLLTVRRIWSGQRTGTPIGWAAVQAWYGQVVRAIGGASAVKPAPKAGVVPHASGMPSAGQSQADALDEQFDPGIAMLAAEGDAK